MTGASCRFVAGRENQVFHVSGAKGDFALRIRRPGLRNAAELRSELQWLAAMARAGLSVPRPKPSVSGEYVETIAGHQVDMVGWMTGQPMGQSLKPLRLNDPGATFFRLGHEMARLHAASDAFDLPAGFLRPRWDIDGLLGETPLWGRFWDNPTLDDDSRAMLRRFRKSARRDLDAMAERLDHGLIHADLVGENILVDGKSLHLIDFDDGGFGFRLFDIATALLKHRTEPDYGRLQSMLLDGYLSVRALDMSHLDLFLALRAVTYVGWIMPRMDEDGSRARNTRFIADARALCLAYLERPSTS